MGKIEKNDEYYERCHYERINNVRLGESLSEPPALFSDLAKQAWRKDVQHYCDSRAFENRFGFWVPDFSGPYNVIIDYTREDEGPKLLFHLTSLAEDGERTIKIDCRGIKKEIRSDRELVIGLSEAFRVNVDISPRIIGEIDALKRLHHGGAAQTIMGLFEEQSIRCRSLDFFKNMFALLRVVVPVEKELTQKLSLVYGRGVHP